MAGLVAGSQWRCEANKKMRWPSSTGFSLANDGAAGGGTAASSGVMLEMWAHFSTHVGRRWQTQSCPNKASLRVEVHIKPKCWRKPIAKENTFTIICCVIEFVILNKFKRRLIRREISVLTYLCVRESFLAWCLANISLNTLWVFVSAILSLPRKITQFYNQSRKWGQVWNYIKWCNQVVNGCWLQKNCFSKRDDYSFKGIIIRNKKVSIRLS